MPINKAKVDKNPSVRSYDPQTSREVNISATKTGNGFKPGTDKSPKGGKMAPGVSATGRTWMPSTRNSGNTFKAKPGAR